MRSLKRHSSRPSGYSGPSLRNTASSEAQAVRHPEQVKLRYHQGDITGQIPELFSIQMSVSIHRADGTSTHIVHDEFQLDDSTAYNVLVTAIRSQPTRCINREVQLQYERYVGLGVYERWQIQLSNKRTWGNGWRRRRRRESLRCAKASNRKLYISISADCATVPITARNPKQLHGSSILYHRIRVFEEMIHGSYLFAPKFKSSRWQSYMNSPNTSRETFLTRSLSKR